MPVQQEDVTALFRLAQAYDWESFQERLRRISLQSPTDVVRALGMVHDLEHEGEADAAHMLADDLLLRYIDEAEITRAFYRVHR